MSVILDALKKAQQDRKNDSGNIPFKFAKNAVKSKRKMLFIIAGFLCFVLIIMVSSMLYKSLSGRTSTGSISKQSLPAGAVPGKTPAKTDNNKVPPENEPSAEAMSLSQTKSNEADKSPDQAGIEQAKTNKIQTQLTKKNKEENTNTEQKTEDYGHPEATKKVHADNAGKSKKHANRKAPASDIAFDYNREESTNYLNGKPRVIVKRLSDEKINMLYNEALQEANSGNFEEAKKIYLSILLESPNHVESLNNLGTIAMKEGNTKEAMFYFRKTLECNKNYEKAYNNMGLIMMREGENRLAEEHFRKAIELDREGIEPYLNLSALLRKEKRFDEASKILETLLKKGEKDPAVHLSYALIKDEMGQYEEAIRHYRYCLRSGSKNAERNMIIERLKHLERDRLGKHY